MEKWGDVSIGAVSALTNREYARVLINDDEKEVEVEPLTSYNMLRAQKEFNKGLQGLGVIGSYVYRNFKDKDLRNYFK